MKYFNEALTLSRQLGDENLEAAALDGISAAYDDLGRKQQDSQLLNDLLLPSLAGHDIQFKVVTPNFIDGVFSGFNKQDQASNYNEESLPPIGPVDDKQDEDLYDKAGQIFEEGRMFFDVSTLESMQAALPKFEQSRHLFQGLNAPQDEANCLGWLGSVSNSLGDKQKALDYYLQALPLYRTIDDKEREADTLTGIGAVYFAFGENQQALKNFDQSLSLYRAIGNTEGEANTLNHISGVYNKQLLEESVALAKEGTPELRWSN